MSNGFSEEDKVKLDLSHLWCKQGHFITVTLLLARKMIAAQASKSVRTSNGLVLNWLLDHVQ